MKLTVQIHRDKTWEEIYLRIYFLIKKNNWQWLSIATIATLSGGLLSPVVGILLDFIIWFVGLGQLKTYLYEGSIIFYVLTLPLLFLASHFLDLLEKKSSIIFPSKLSIKLESQEFNMGLKP